MWVAVRRKGNTRRSAAVAGQGVPPFFKTGPSLLMHARYYHTPQSQLPPPLLLRAAGSTSRVPPRSPATLCSSAKRIAASAPLLWPGGASEGRCGLSAASRAR